MMTMPICALCGKEEEGMLRCTKCKALFYCSAACQKRDWKLHKQFCSGDAAMRPFVAVEHEVERTLAALREHQVPPPPDVHCFICLEGGADLLSQGCGCRGGSGFAHAACLETMAASSSSQEDDVQRYLRCATCHQQLMEVVKLLMRRRLWRSRRLSKNKVPRGLAALFLARGLFEESTSPDYRVQKYLHDEATRGLDANHPRRVTSHVELAQVLLKLRRPSDALRLLQAAYPKVICHCGEWELYLASQTMAVVLEDLGRLDQATPFALTAVDMAGRIRDDEARHLATNTYVAILARSGHLHEARTFWTNEIAFWERVYGPDHTYTKRVKRLIETYS